MGEQSQSAIVPLTIENLVRSNQDNEAGYRRGVSQALNLAADLIQQGCSHDDLNWLCNESMRMRCDRKPYPAYLDELRERYRKWQERMKG